MCSNKAVRAIAAFFCLVFLTGAGWLPLVKPNPIDPAAQAWANAVVAASGTVSNAQLVRVSNLISCYKTNSIWTGKDREWLGASENATQATIDLVNLQSATNNSMTFVAGHGYTGNAASSYIDTNYIPSTGGGNFALNNNEMHVYLATSRTSAQAWASMGTNNTSFSADWFIYPWFVDGNSYGANQTVSNSIPAPANAGGFWANSRIANGSATEYQNGVQFLTIGAGGAILAPLSIVVGARRDNTAGAPSDFSGDSGFALYGFGAGLTATQEAAQSNCVNAYMTSLGINVYAAGTGTTLQATASQMPALFTGHAGSTLPIFGINTHTTIDNLGITTISPAQNLAMVQTLGVSLVRIDATNWQVVEPTGGGTYTYANGDPYITGASGFRTAGLTVQPIVAYSNTNYEASIFTGPTDATGKTAYNNYAGGAATGLVAHYGATGFIYELWNEENISTGVGNYAWSPSANATDYSTLATGAAAAIVGRTASAKIITGGVAPTGAGIAPNTYGATMNNALTWTNFQGAGLHPYNAGLTTGVIPEQSYFDSLSFAAAVTNATGIYWSEVGYQLSDVGTETVKAVYDSRSVLAGALAGAKEVAVYQLASSAGYGLFDSSFNILPAGTAYKNLITALTSCTTINANTYNNQAMWSITCKFTGGNRRIVWNAYASFTYTDDQEVSISAASAQDLFGNAVSVTVNGNVATIPISVAGGPVVLSVTN